MPGIGVKIRRVASCPDIWSVLATPLRTCRNLLVVCSRAGLTEHGKSIVLLILTLMGVPGREPGGSLQGIPVDRTGRKGVTNGLVAMTATYPELAHDGSARGGRYGRAANGRLAYSYTTSVPGHPAAFSGFSAKLRLLTGHRRAPNQRLVLTPFGAGQHSPAAFREST